MVLSESDEPGDVDVSEPAAAWGPLLERPPRASDTVLVLGWNSGAPHLIDSIRRDLHGALNVTVVIEADVTDETAGFGPDSVVAHIRPEGGIQHWLDDEANRAGYHHAIVLTDETKAPDVADTETLLAFLALRPAGANGNPETVVAELRQRSSKHLVARHEADDLIAGGALTADALAQYAVNPGVASVFDQLFGDGAFEIDLVAPGEYGLADEFGFRDVVRAAADRGEIALGYRLRTSEAPVGSGGEASPRLVLNPRKDALDTDPSGRSARRRRALRRRRPSRSGGVGRRRERGDVVTGREPTVIPRS